jgi:DNA-binding CsgD family transcriptional regulator
MDEAEQVSRLVGEIYDAALDQALWPSVLEKTCEFVQGQCAGLVGEDFLKGAGQFYFSWGLDPEYERLYLDKYIKLNTAGMIALCSTKPGDVFSTELLMPYDEFLASRLYLEWAKPQGFCDIVAALLEKSTTSFTNLGIVRHERQGIADEATRRRMALLVPHFQRSANIGKVIALPKLEAAALADTLDALPTALFLVAADAQIVHANASGQAMLADGFVLQRLDGRLAPANPETARSLHDIFSAAEQGDAGVGARGAAILLSATSDAQFVAHVLPLTSGTRRHVGASYACVAAVFVRKIGPDLPHPVAAFAEHYRLTPAELRVTMGIMNVGGVREVAPVLGISATTARTHLQHVFEKTGTNRQADLVKLVAGFGPLS